jgi:hypothetical protein
VLSWLTLVTPVLRAQQNDTLPSPPSGQPVCSACPDGLRLGFQPDTVTQGRPHAIHYSDAYATRLKIHAIGSYVALPLYAAEYVLGQKLLTEEQNNPFTRSSLRGPHKLVATALGAVFTVNTVTGVWNLLESRKDPAGRTRRWVHSIAMMVADGGMVASAMSAGAARRTNAGANQHKVIGISSMGLAVAASAMMWLWKD